MLQPPGRCEVFDTVVCGDTLEAMAKLPAGCADLVFADPPFNINYAYDVYQDRRPREEYLGWTERWLAAAVRLLKPDGTLWVAIGDEWVAEHKIRCDALGLTLRNWVVWHYTFGVACQGKFSRSHAHLLYYVRDHRSYHFDADAVRVPSARQTTYGDRRASGKGKLPDDTWVLRPADAPEAFAPDSDTWAVSRVCGTFRERTGHPCQMPEAVLERIIRACSAPGDLVVDPFCGSGTTAAVARRLGRQYWTCDLSADYVAAARERLARVEAPCSTSI
jgi:site-specific DNA-methyltransferase (adenine-specific)